MFGIRLFCCGNLLGGRFGIRLWVVISKHEIHAKDDQQKTAQDDGSHGDAPQKEIETGIPLNQTDGTGATWNWRRFGDKDVSANRTKPYFRNEPMLHVLVSTVITSAGILLQQ